MQSSKLNKFIVLEGISGSGKTEIGTRLAECISAQYYTTPPALFRNLREEADKSLCVEARFLFYLSSVVQASWEIGKILETQSVVCDKYIWSTICYHSVFGINIDLPLLNVYRQPDYVFLIVCDEEKRLERLRVRRLRSNGRFVVDKEKYNRRQEMERRCLIEFRKYIQSEIDNTPDGPYNAVGQILANMK